MSRTLLHHRLPKSGNRAAPIILWLAASLLTPLAACSSGDARAPTGDATGTLTSTSTEADNESDDPTGGGFEARCDMARFEAECTIGCPYGYKDGAGVCPDCECRPAWGPPRTTAECPATCPVRCEQGWRTDANGCLSCECPPSTPDEDLEDPVCMPLTEFHAICTIGCPYGYASDANNCELCECRPQLLPTPTGSCNRNLSCPVHCEHGYKSDAKGCLTCECGR